MPTPPWFRPLVVGVAVILSGCPTLKPSGSEVDAGRAGTRDGGHAAANDDGGASKGDAGAPDAGASLTDDGGGASRGDAGATDAGGGFTDGGGGCRPKYCWELAFCGVTVDGCGGTLSCGSCPAGFSCDVDHGCMSSDWQHLVLDVAGEEVAISGTVTHNGTLPVSSKCEPSNQIGLGRVRLTSPNRDAYARIDSCTNVSDPYAWSMKLPAGTYAVSVTGETYSALPHWPVLVNSQLVVNADQANLVLNVVDPLWVAVSGSITVNSAAGTSTSCGGKRAEVVFTDVANDHNEQRVVVGACTHPNDPFSWATTLRPGTYRVVVAGESGTSVPPFDVVVNDHFVVTAGAPQSNVVLNIVDPAKVTVSGTVTLNGSVPLTTKCSSSSRAFVWFQPRAGPGSASAIVGPCAAVTDSYAWSVGLRPGTYTVTISGWSDNALPGWAYEVTTGFVVAGAQSNVAFDVVDPAQVAISGTLTQNQLVPLTSKCGPYPYRARVIFTHATNAHYSSSLEVPGCASPTDPYLWSTTLRPGRYTVSAIGTDISSLLGTPVVLNTGFVVQAGVPQSQVVLDEAVPLPVAVSGSVTLNHTVPISVCEKYRSRAWVRFENATSPEYSQEVSVPECAKSTDPLSWSTQLRPGTYLVTVRGENITSPLPDWALVVSPAFVVTTTPQSNVQLDVAIGPKVTVSGVITQRGAVPRTRSCGKGARAAVSFTHLDFSGHSTGGTGISYEGRVADCVSATDPYVWSVELWPGFYDVEIDASTASALPEWTPVMFGLHVK